MVNSGVSSIENGAERERDRRVAGRAVAVMEAEPLVRSSVIRPFPSGNVLDEECRNRHECEGFNARASGLGQTPVAGKPAGEIRRDEEAHDIYPLSKGLEVVVEVVMPLLPIVADVLVVDGEQSDRAGPDGESSPFSVVHAAWHVDRFADVPNEIARDRAERRDRWL